MSGTGLFGGLYIQGPWFQTGTVIRETDTANTVVIGATVMAGAERLRVTGGTALVDFTNTRAFVVAITGGVPSTFTVNTTDGRVILEPLAAAAGSDSVALDLVGQTSIAARTVRVFNEADPATDTRRLTIRDVTAALNLIQAEAIAGASRVGINVGPSAGFALDVTGATRITGKLTVTGALDPTDITLSGGGTAHFQQWGAGSTAAVSAATTMRLRYNEVTNTAQVSFNTAAFVDITTGAAASGWTDDGGTVRLTTASDVLAAGTAVATANRKLTILQTGANAGIRVEGAAAADNILDSLVTLDTNARFSADVSGRLSWGPGNAALDTAISRGAANRLDLATGDSLNLVDGAYTQLRTTGLPMDIERQDASVATVLGVLILRRTTSAGALAGIGARVSFESENTVGAVVTAAEVDAFLSSATEATREGVIALRAPRSNDQALTEIARFGGGDINGPFAIVGGTARVGAGRLEVQSGRLAVGFTSSAATYIGNTGLTEITFTVDSVAHQILGRSTVSATVPRWSFDTDADTGVGRDAADSLALVSGGTTLVRVEGGAGTRGTLRAEREWATTLKTVTLSASVNDWTGPDATAYLRVDPDIANVNVTGIANGTNGRRLTIRNVGGTFNVTLVNDSVSSLVQNRMLLAGSADVIITPRDIVVLIYDSTTSRWIQESALLAL